MGCCFNKIKLVEDQPINKHKQCFLIDTLQKDSEKYNKSIYKNVATDIIDDKHIKYMSRYKEDRQLFWGLGIENESYLQMDRLRTSDEFRQLRQKRERYSVNYYLNFKLDPLNKCMETLMKMDSIKYPIYVNAHTFQHTDTNEHHQYVYDVESRSNPEFTQSIHDLLLKENEYYREEYNKSFVFDGDSIEFITQDFYKTNVDKCISELIATKTTFLREINQYTTYCKNMEPLGFPSHNYGLVSFHTTGQKQLGICNNGTYHINITLPTYIKNTVIENRPKFISQHMTFVKCIQIVEPLLVAVYGSPDILSVLNPEYSIGSLRVSLSRYISLQTFNADKPTNGKLLLTGKPRNSTFWYSQMDKSPYQTNDLIGFDINFNKFKNHGVELRFFDWFPTEYLKDVLNFLVLLAAHSLTLRAIDCDKVEYTDIILKCVRKGHRAFLTKQECAAIVRDLQLCHLGQTVEEVGDSIVPEAGLTPRQSRVSIVPEAGLTPFELLTLISDTLFDIYEEADVVKCMSPGMKRPQLVDYNKMAFEMLKQDLYSD
jgi:hypothetical protein